jgi:hypothetical protein
MGAGSPEFLPEKMVTLTTSSARHRRTACSRCACSCKAPPSFSRRSLPSAERIQSPCAIRHKTAAWTTSRKRTRNNLQLRVQERQVFYRQFLVNPCVSLRVPPPLSSSATKPNSARRRDINPPDQRISAHAPFPEQSTSTSGCEPHYS